MKDASVHRFAARQAQQVEDGGCEVHVARGTGDGRGLLERWPLGEEHVAGLVGAHGAVLAESWGKTGGRGMAGESGVVGRGVPTEGHGQAWGAGPLQTDQARGQSSRRGSGGIGRHQCAAPRLGGQPLHEPINRRAWAALGLGGVEQRRPPVGSDGYATRSASRREPRLTQQRLYFDDLGYGRVAVVRSYNHVGLPGQTLLVQPAQQSAKLPVGFQNGVAGGLRADAVGMLRGVGLGKPQQ